MLQLFCGVCYKPKVYHSEVHWASRVYSMFTVKRLGFGSKASPSSQSLSFGAQKQGNHEPEIEMYLDLQKSPKYWPDI